MSELKTVKLSQIVPNPLGTEALDYPPGYVREADRSETFEPDVIERSEVERIIREFASEVGYPSYAQRLIDRLPRQDSTVEESWVVTMRFHPDESAPVDEWLGNLIEIETTGLEVVKVERLQS